MNDTPLQSDSTTKDGRRVLLDVKGLVKRFGSTTALDGINLRLFGGRAHALLGTNGCGKSTLVKTLAGYHTPDEGSIAMAPLSEPGKRPIAFVHQDLGLIPNLSVTENLALSSDIRTTAGAIRWEREHKRTQELLTKHGIRCKPHEAVGGLGPAEQSMVAIVRALWTLPSHGGVLVLDEPTARLPAAEVEQLLVMLNGLKLRGVAILYISHRLDEVLRLADDLTVLRDGKCVHSGTIDATTREDLVRLIVGHDIVPADQEAKHTRRSIGTALDVKGLSGIRVQDVSLEIGAGEIVGVAGLVGSGRSELGRLLFGLQKPTAGSVRLHGKDITGMTTGKAVAAGIAYVPQERKSGIFSGLSIADNAILANLTTVMGRFGVSARAITRAADELVASYQVKTDGLEKPIDTLSGGNQQKISLGKWLRRELRLLILDEPTQGIDVGARTEIFAIIRRAVSDRNIGVVVFDSDLEILAEHCDRVLVMKHGRLVGEFKGASLTAAGLNHYVLES